MLLFTVRSSAATSEPLIATPDVVGGIPLDDSVSFFALLSAGLSQALADAGGLKTGGAAGVGGQEEVVNAFIANLIMQQMSAQTTLNSVAQVWSFPQRFNCEEGNCVADAGGAAHRPMGPSVTGFPQQKALWI